MGRAHTKLEEDSDGESPVSLTMMYPPDWSKLPEFFPLEFVKTDHATIEIRTWHDPTIVVKLCEFHLGLNLRLIMGKDVMIFWPNYPEDVPKVVFRETMYAYNTVKTGVKEKSQHTIPEGESGVFLHKYPGIYHCYAYALSPSLPHRQQYSIRAAEQMECEIKS